MTTLYIFNYYILNIKINVPFIKSLDVFGHPITINMNQSKGAAHKTIFGGLASALIKISLLFIFVISI